jgi:hypothetical protein
MQFTITQMQLAGSYDRNSYATTLQENKGMAFTLSASPAALGGGPITIGLLTPAGSTGKWVSGSNPTEGKFQVNVSAGYTIGTIMVEVNGGGTGVSIYLNGAFQKSLTWNEFTDTMTLTNDYAIIASLAYNVLQAVYRCVSITYTMLELVMENQDTLTQSMINASKTGYYGLTANMTAQWVDNNSNGNIDPGDGFFSRFSSWWVDNSGTNQDYIYNGRVVWVDYWEIVNSSGTTVGGDFKIGVSGDALYEDEVDSGVTQAGTRITYQESGFLFLLSW